ncbi:MAG: cytochrome c [Proteobacteria bacterium]|nr:cytochrome c [Pseudomonadota bacterium]
MKRPINRHHRKQPENTNIECPGTHKQAKRVTLIFALVLAVCIAPASAHEPVKKDLKGFYQQNCVSCHGPDGSAISVAGKKLRGQDFTDPKWQRGTRDDKMVAVILKGKFFGLAMPGYKDTLTGDEAQQMVTDIIRKSKKGQVIAPDAGIPGEK